jgi:predicted nucleic acid-binding protein
MIDNSSIGTPRSWRTLYKAALAEKDVQKLPFRIEEAREALILRSRELFSTSRNYDNESEAVDDAMYALAALENCLKLSTKDRRRAPRIA